MFGKLLPIISNAGIFILDSIKSFFKWMFKDSKNLIITILGVIILLLLLHTIISRKKYKTDLSDLKDKSEIYENKIGELYRKGELYEVTIKDLKKTNKELYDEVKNLHDNPIIVTKIKYLTKLDTMRIESIVYVQDTNTCVYESPFAFKDDWCDISGVSVFDMRTMRSDIMFGTISFNDEITLDIIDKNKKLYLLAKSANPYTTVTDVYGVAITKEMEKMLKKHYRKPWGIMIGAGVTAGVVGKQFKCVPGIQLTIGYKFISF